MCNNLSFKNILEHSKKLEIERLDRAFNEIMLDEYVLDDELKHKLAKGEYQFPNVLDVKTDKRILTRTQEQFSAKIHIRRTPLYFHRHEYIELLYLYKGSCRQFIENLNQCITLQEGDLFILNQNVTHALLQTDDQAVLIKIIIPTSWISHEFIQKLGQQSSMFDFFANSKAERNEYYHYLYYRQCFEEKSLIENIMTEYYREQQHYIMVLKSYFQLLMAFLDRNEKVYDNYKYRLSHNSVQTGEIIQYIYDYSDSITLKMLADKFSFNQSYLSRMIKENCKMSFQNLVKECRIEKSALLLSSSNYSIEKIAQIVGYQNAASIYNGMKERFGLSPNEYRNIHGKNNIDSITNE